MVIAEVSPVYAHQVILTRGGGGGGGRASASSGRSSGGYSSTRSSSSSSTSKSGYSSTRSSTPITRSNINQMTTPTQRTTIVNNYTTGYIGYHSFFHPFGWGMYGGDFWMWMYIFDHDHYTQNQQIVQAQGVAAPAHNEFWQDLVFILIAISLVAGIWWLIWWFVH